MGYLQGYDMIFGLGRSTAYHCRDLWKTGGQRKVQGSYGFGKEHSVPLHGPVENWKAKESSGLVRFWERLGYKAAFDFVNVYDFIALMSPLNAMEIPRRGYSGPLPFWKNFFVLLLIS